MKYESEIGALILKSDRSLRVAKSLISSGDYDFAISRAYYAMFYCAEALLLMRDLKYSKHSAVIASFGKELVKSGIMPEELYKNLLTGFRERQKSDYDVISIPLRENTEDIVKKAEIFLNKTKEYLRSSGYNL